MRMPLRSVSSRMSEMPSNRLSSTWSAMFLMSWRRISYFNQLLASEEMLRGVLKEELTAIRDKYGDERIANRRLSTTWGLASRLSSMTMRMPLRSVSSRMSEMPSNRLSEAEYKELEERISYFNQLLASEEMLRGVLKEELTACCW